MVQEAQEDMAARSMGLGDQENFVAQSEMVQRPSHHTLSAPANQVYYFDYDSNVVHRSDIPSLDMQANYLMRHRKAHVRIEGHTDERGSREYNVALGWRRAKPGCSSYAAVRCVCAPIDARELWTGKASGSWSS